MEKKNLRSTEKTHRDVRGEMQKNTDRNVHRPMDINKLNIQHADRGDMKPGKLNVDLTKIDKHQHMYKRLEKDITFSKYKVNLDAVKRKIDNVTPKTVSSSNPPFGCTKGIPRPGVVRNVNSEFKDQTKRAGCGKQKKEKSNPTSISTNTENVQTDDKDTKPARRHPIIKTVTSKADKTKIFKAVTFTAAKKNTQLNVNIPGDLKKNTRVPSTNSMVKTATVSSASMTERVLKKKKKYRRKNRLVSSPNLPVRLRSPTTEVAKWAPASTNRFTKPYYEAWVDTSLAAVSKNKDKVMEKRILQSLKDFERQASSELVHENYRDERYVGRIKFRQR